MADNLTPEERSRNMSRIRSKDTSPEMIVRKLVHRLGYRYRLHRQDLPGKPDLVFPSRKKVIFVHGCFWHQHKDPKCKKSVMPKSRLEYWEPKLHRNITLDQSHKKALNRMGWKVLVLWECEVSETNRIKEKIQDFLA